MGRIKELIIRGDDFLGEVNDSDTCRHSRGSRTHQDKINRTPVMTSETLDAQAGARLFFKCENLQKVGAFKARGATNAVLLLYR